MYDYYFIGDKYIQEKTVIHTILIGVLVIALVINHVRNNKATTAKNN